MYFIKLSWIQLEELQALIEGIQGARVGGSRGYMVRETTGWRAAWQITGVDIAFGGEKDGQTKPDTTN